MEYINDTYGLVTKNDLTSENGSLFLVEYMMLCQMKGDLMSAANASATMIRQLEKSKEDKWLYNRNPELLNKCNSHDNLSGIFSFSYLQGTNHTHNIWQWLVWHLGTYDNTDGRDPSIYRFFPFNPGNFFIWGKCAESWFYMLFLPIYLINLIISNNKAANDTSGKILSWVELYPHKEHWLCKLLFNYYEKKMKSVYGEDYLKELMKIYFLGNDSDFPIFKVLGV